MLPYANIIRSMANAETDFDDGVVFTLHSSGYALNRATHQYVSDLTNELATANGYVVGGVAAGVLSRTLTAANSWGVVRANGTAYALGDVVRPAATNGFLYRAVAVSGVTAGAPPAYPTAIGQTVVDGGVTWACYGIAITVITSANPASWAALSASGIRYMVASDRSTGVAATSPLLAVTDFGSDQTGPGQAWTVAPHPSLGLFHFIHQ